jgi:hypothetical protein
LAAAKSVISGLGVSILISKGDCCSLGGAEGREKMMSWIAALEIEEK